MSDYDTLDEFTGDHAAELMAGANDTNAYKAKLESLRMAYQDALDYYRAIGDQDAPGKWSTRQPLPDAAIQSADMQRCEKTLQRDPKGGTFSAWIALSKTEFDDQKFNREELQRWIDVKRFHSEYRFAGTDVAQEQITAPMVSDHTVTTAPVVVPVKSANRGTSKPSIEVVAMDYMRTEYAAGQFASAAKFHKHLCTTAGTNGSPFEMGTGVNARKLFCPAAGSFFDAGTLGKVWAKVRAT